MLKRKNKKRRSKQIGATVSIEIWTALKIEAVRQGKTTGEILNDSITLYLKNKKSDIFGLGFPLE